MQHTPEAAVDAPTSSTGSLLQSVLAIWCEVLDCSPGQLDADSNFFLLGGDSLQLIRVLNRVRERLQTTLALRDVAHFSTPRKMAACCAAGVNSGYPAAARVQQAPAACGSGGLGEADRFAASAGQTALWLAEQLSDGCGLYNTAAILHLRGSLQVPVLAQALTALLRRHEVLRSRFHFEARAQKLFSVIAPLQEVRLEAVPAESRRARQQLRELAALPFDLARGPLWRFQLLATGKGNWSLLFCLHHCISDGWSGSVLLRELAQAYKGLLADPQWRFPAPECEFRNYCAQQEPMEAADLAWWRLRLAGADQLAGWPQTGGGRWPFALACVERPLPESGLAGVQHAAQRTGINVSAFTLAAVHLALRELHGSAEACIGMPVNVRTSSAQENSVGYFVNLLVLRECIAPAQEPCATLRQVEHNLLEALSHRAAAFPLLVRALNPALLPSGNAWCDLLFAFQNFPPVRPGFTGLQVRMETLTLPYGQHPLKVELVRSGAGWKCRIEYAHEIIARNEIEQFLAGLQMHLARLLQVAVCK